MKMKETENKPCYNSYGSTEDSWCQRKNWVKEQYRSDSYSRFQDMLQRYSNKMSMIYIKTRHVDQWEKIDASVM